MQELDKTYLSELEDIATQIQSSDALANYLENEEESDYEDLKNAFEPKIRDLHTRVAAENPLQLIPLETVLLRDEFEGLFLPRILGYSVLRGELNEDFHYVRPQSHFKEVLSAIGNSANFELLKKRVGQAIQAGLALSSDIWETSVINSFSNKRIRYFLQGLKLDDFRFVHGREKAYRRFNLQFKNENYQTADFPETQADLHILFNSLKEFLLYRVGTDYDNSSLIGPLMNFARNKDLQGSKEYMIILAIFAGFFDLEEADHKELSDLINSARKSHNNFDEVVSDLIESLHTRKDTNWTPAADGRFSKLLDRNQEGILNEYFDTTDILHQNGYAAEESKEAVRIQHRRHQGLSTINENLRQTVYQYFERFLSNLETDEYTEFFELPKHYTAYMEIFNNQQFNQQLKELSLSYVKKLINRYTDKRGKDYQDIKKFVRTSFKDMKFMTDKQLVELFKTRRKRKPKKVEE